MALPKTNEPPPRIQIQRVTPQIDCGRYPVKRTEGDRVDVTALIFRDGHETLGAAIRYKPAGATRWQEAPLDAARQRRVVGIVRRRPLRHAGRYRIEAWVDRVASFQEELRRKLDAGQTDLAGELAEGAALLGSKTLTLEEALAAPLERPVRQVVVGDARGRRRPRARALRRVVRALPALLGRLRGRAGGAARSSPSSASTSSTCRRSTRSGSRTAKAGTTRSRQGRRIPAARGRSARRSGGHDAINPELGTLEEFEQLVADAKTLGIEIAIDFAIQCSPDHPWLKQHPEWFNRRPDGTLKYAENPPKRYQDIYNVNFDSEDWKGLWAALRDVVLFWVARGVTVFRVDNPHTKPVAFWEWLIGEVRGEHPEVIFLAEAFTRPAMMQTLGKIGFAQSYTYFTWKNTRWELLEFMGQLLEWRDYYRPNCFANTPDILHEYLVRGGPPAFEARLVLAATLSPSYGIYSGFESFENVPVREGSEEYLDSEKYEVKKRALDGPLLPLVERAERAPAREPGAAAPRQRHVPRDRERAALRAT